MRAKVDDLPKGEQAWVSEGSLGLDHITCLNSACHYAPGLLFQTSNRPRLLVPSDLHSCCSLFLNIFAGMAQVSAPVKLPQIGLHWYPMESYSPPPYTAQGLVLLHQPIIKAINIILVSYLLYFLHQNVKFQKSRDLGTLSVLFITVSPGPRLGLCTW